MTEEETGLTWYPRKEWTDEDQSMGSFARIFGTEQPAVAYAWSKLDVTLPGSTPIILKGSHDGALTLYVDGTEVYSAGGSANFHVELPRRYGFQIWSRRVKSRQLAVHGDSRWKMPSVRIPQAGD
ncbi:hypothetical protein Q0F98_08760 [Paenibacillus amylolyticus]|nr:hypothetical protein Q0F98_08760 [Paenibacillus amylolyticus]